MILLYGKILQFLVLASFNTVARKWQNIKIWVTKVLILIIWEFSWYIFFFCFVYLAKFDIKYTSIKPVFCACLSWRLSFEDLDLHGNNPHPETFQDWRDFSLCWSGHIIERKDQRCSVAMWSLKARVCWRGWGTWGTGGWHLCLSPNIWPVSRHKPRITLF